MWTKEISDIILDYYSLYYASRERAYYQIEIGNCIIGGIRGYKLLIGEEPLPTDPYELFSYDLVKDARAIADQFFIKTCNPLTRVNTRVPYREVWIDVSNRLAAIIFSDLTTSHSCKEVIVNEVESQQQQVFGLLLDQKQDIELQHKKSTYRVVGPTLYIIDYLKHLYDPLEQKERENNIAAINKLLPLVDKKYLGDYYKTVDDEYKSFNKCPNDIKAYLKGRVFVGFRNEQVFLLSDNIDDEDLPEKQAVYTMQLPNEFYLKKLIIRKGKIKINIFTNAYHELLPIRDNKVLESVRTRYYMIEDNTAFSLLEKGILQFVKPLTTKKDIEHALIEEYPTAASYEESLELFKTSFYGIYRNPSTVKKIYVKTQDRVGPYYPYVYQTCDGVMPDIATLEE